MKLSIPCRNCGGPLDVNEETINNAATLGVELSAAHDVCPNAVTVIPDTPKRVVNQYRLQLVMVKVPDDEAEKALFDQFLDGVGGESFGGVEVLAGAGETVESATFAQAVNGPFTTWLNTTWPKLQENAAFAELPPSPATAP